MRADETEPVTVEHGPAGGKLAFIDGPSFAEPRGSG